VEEEEFPSLKRGADFEQDVPSAKRPKITEESAAAPCPVSDEPGQERNRSSELVVSVSSSSEPKSNGSFVFCSEAQQVTNLYEGSQSVTNAPLITFLLPADVLNGTLPLRSHDESSLLEVSCQVLNISIFPWSSSDLTRATPEPHLL